MVLVEERIGTGHRQEQPSDFPRSFPPAFSVRQSAQKWCPQSRLHHYSGSCRCTMFPMYLPRRPPLRRDSTHLHRSAEAVKVREARTQDLLHVGEGDGGKVQIFRRAVLRDKQVGIADEIPLIGIAYFIVIPACSGEIVGDALLHILNAFSENRIDRKRQPDSHFP